MTIRLVTALMTIFVGAATAKISPTFPVGVVLEDPARRQQVAISLALSQAPHLYATSVVEDRVDVLDTARDPYLITSAVCKLLKEGVFAFIGQQTPSTTDLWVTIANALGVPFINLGDPMVLSEYGIHMVPNYNQALVDVINHYKWTTVYYMYDTPEGRDRFQDLLIYILSNNTRFGHIQLRLLPVRDANHAQDVVRKVSQGHRHNLHVIVDLSKDQARDFFKAEDTDDILPMGEKLGGSVQMTGLRLINRDTAKRSPFTHEYSKQTHIEPDLVTLPVALAADASTLLAKALTQLELHHGPVFISAYISKKLYYNGTYGMDCYTDPLTQWQHGSNLTTELKQIKFRGLTGQIAFNEHGLRRTYELDVLEKKHTKGLQKIGVWNSETESIDLLTPIQMKPTSDPQDSPDTLVITSILTSPYLVYRQGNHTGNEQWEGYCADLAKLLCDRLRVPYVIKVISDGQYGSINPDGTWNGMIGELVRREADLSVAPLTITSSREKVVDFSKPFMSSGISIMVKKHTRHITTFFIFSPVSYEVWGCILIAFVCASVVLFFVSLISPWEVKLCRGKESKITKTFDIWDSFWYTCAGLTRHCIKVSPRSVSGRIMGCTLSFCALLIFCCFLAQLFSFLTVTRQDRPVLSAQDLAEQTSIKYGTIKQGSTMEFFKYSNIGVYERMWAFMQQNPEAMVSTNEEGVQHVRQGGGRYAFLLDSNTNDYINQRQPCDTMRIGPTLNSRGYGIATPLGSPLRERINLAVLELKEDGELARLESKWWYARGECGHQPAKFVEKGKTGMLTLRHLRGLFYILALGLILAVVVAAVQLIIYSCVQARAKSTPAHYVMWSHVKFAFIGKKDSKKESDEVTMEAQNESKPSKEAEGTKESAEKGPVEIEEAK